nr:hypothetical protein [Sphingobacterium siyangense]
MLRQKPKYLAKIPNNEPLNAVRKGSAPKVNITRGTIKVPVASPKKKRGKTKSYTSPLDESNANIYMKYIVRQENPMITKLIIGLPIISNLAVVKRPMHIPVMLASQMGTMFTGLTPNTTSR